MEEKMQKALFDRKSVRSYLDQEVEEEKKDLILNAALRSATAGNMSLYKIIDIQDQKIKDRLALSCDHQPFIATAPLLLLFVIDYQGWYRLFKEIDPHCKKPGMGDLMLGACDALVAAQSAAICAQSLGLGSCYIGDVLEEAELHRDMFKLPKYTMPITLLAIGYPTEHQKNRPQPPRFSKEAMVSTDTYREKSLEELKEDLHVKNPRLGAQGQINDLFHRKWTSEFLLEMERSVEQWLSWWKE